MKYFTSENIPIYGICIVCRTRAYLNMRLSLQQSLPLIISPIHCESHDHIRTDVELLFHGMAYCTINTHQANVSRVNDVHDCEHVISGVLIIFCVCPLKHKTMICFPSRDYMTGLHYSFWLVWCLCVYSSFRC